MQETDAAAPSDGAHEDGRRRRSQRTRARILSAVAELLSEHAELSFEQVASRSGTSVSTVARNMRDQEGLVRAMREIAKDRVIEHLDAGRFEGPIDLRVADLVRRLGGVFEIVVPLLRFMERYRQDEQLANSRREIDRLTMAVVGQALAAELAQGPPELADVLGAVVSPHTWSQLRRNQGFDVARASATLRATVLRIVGEDWPPVS